MHTHLTNYPTDLSDAEWEQIKSLVPTPGIASLHTEESWILAENNEVVVDLFPGEEGAVSNGTLYVSLATSNKAFAKNYDFSPRHAQRIVSKLARMGWVRCTVSRGNLRHIATEAPPATKSER